MKTSKLAILWGLTLLTGMVVGGAGMRLYQAAHPSYAPAPVAAATLQPELSLAQLKNATLPSGTQEAQPAAPLQSSAQLPSQLVRSDLPQDVDVAHSGAAAAQAAMPEEEKPAGVVLSAQQDTLVLNAKQPVARASDGSNVTLIEAPVAVKRIQTLDQYKAFKTQARGSYPSADFAREEVIVLESASNLPDNVFEIVEIVPTEQNLKVLYRVNVFGLDKKTNTHSAQKIKKTSLPIILSQVL